MSSSLASRHTESELSSALTAPSVDYRLPHSPLGIQKASFRLLSLLPRLTIVFLTRLSAYRKQAFVCSRCSLGSAGLLLSLLCKAETLSVISVISVGLTIIQPIPLPVKGPIFEIREICVPFITSLQDRDSFCDFCDICVTSYHFSFRETN